MRRDFFLIYFLSLFLPFTSMATILLNILHMFDHGVLLTATLVSTH